LGFWKMRATTYARTRGEEQAALSSRYHEQERLRLMAEDADEQDHHLGVSGH
jgi:hypothetical protein